MGKTTFPFPNISDKVVEICGWISTYIPHFIKKYYYLSILGKNLIQDSKSGPQICHQHKSRRNRWKERWHYFWGLILVIWWCGIYCPFASKDGKTMTHCPELFLWTVVNMAYGTLFDNWLTVSCMHIDLPSSTIIFIISALCTLQLLYIPGSLTKANGITGCI